MTSAAFSCLAVAVFLGASGRLVTRERPLVRLLADASYFTYVTHMPLVVLLQIGASRLAWPGPLKYAGVVTLTTGGHVCTTNVPTAVPPISTVKTPTTEGVPA